MARAVYTMNSQQNSGFSIDSDNSCYARSVSESVSKTIAATVPQYLILAGARPQLRRDFGMGFTFDIPGKR
jgi:hypothetical protein